ncbi:hypothetical protein Tco_1206080 [Tanacetum coccineum]
MLIQGLFELQGKKMKEIESRDLKWGFELWAGKLVLTGSRVRGNRINCSTDQIVQKTEKLSQDMQLIQKLRQTGKRMRKFLEVKSEEVDVQKKDAYGGASWNPWSLGCNRTGLSRRQEEQHCERTEYSNMNNDSRRGRGRSLYSRERGRGRGRGHGQGSGRGNTQNHGQRDSSKNHEDHEQKGKQQEPCNYSYFSELNENITSRVRFGDGLCASIKGKGNDFVPRRVESDQTWEYAANPKVAGQYQPTVSQARKGWKIHHLDAKTTFLHGDLKEEVYDV